MITYPRYPRRDCLNATPQRLLMVQLPAGSERVVCLTATNEPVSVQAAYIHPITGKVINTVTLNLKAPSTAYLVRSNKYAGWAYIVMWSVKQQKMLCSCKENTSNSYCQHVDDVPSKTL